MPAATNRLDLLNVTQKDFAKLTALLADVDVDLAKQPFEDGVSIKDVIGHRAHWTGLFFGWYAQGQKTGRADIPAKEYKWNQLKDYNAKLRDDQADLSWDQVQGMLQDSHARLLEFIDGMTEADLYGGPMKGGGNKWTTGRWVEASGASHYRSAAKFVRACLRAKDASGGGI